MVDVVVLTVLIGCDANDTPMAGGHGAAPRDARSVDSLAVDAPLDAAGTDTVLLTQPHCLGLPAICGDADHDDCCASSEVFGGTFYRGYDVAGDADSGTTDQPATISSFRLDKYEVTVGRFRAFVNAGMGTRSKPPSDDSGAHATIPGSGWNRAWNLDLAASTPALIAVLKCHDLATWTDSAGPGDNRPINCVTWYEAMAFCIWDGGYLPTDAEWNYAATGGAEQRIYPWSVPPGSVVIDGEDASYACLGDGSTSCAGTDLLPVGHKPRGDGRWGQSDLAGNALEWVLDGSWFYLNPCIDCAELIHTDNRLLRGGGFDAPADTMRMRTHLATTPASGGFGFRCARAP
ncbi:MAG TPA: SUMF1/EgtB/PvdO family nonheme iron enzyme [Kofleriaceae bacterium]